MKPKKYEVICNYCNNKADIVTGDRIYPHRKDLFSHRFYLCVSCDAYVGTHKATNSPLGRLANAELRREKQKAHNAFDPLWKSNSPGFSRKEAYSWLAKQLGLPERECHIGNFDVETCRRVVVICAAFTEAAEGG